MEIAAFAARLQEIFPALTHRQHAQFAQLLPLYTEWNSRINVISRKDMAHFYLHHVLHSLAIARFTTFAPATAILDVGTGGGFPGIPLAILFPECRFTLVDAIGKKIKVVQAVADAAGLHNITAVHARAETLPANTFDFVVSRAVTALPEFTAWVWHTIRPAGVNEHPNGMLCLKGGDLHDEIAATAQQLHLAPAAITAIPVSFPDAFFAGKMVVYVPGGA